MNYTVIVPFYNEEKNVSRFNNELIKNIMKSNSNNRVFEIIYVDDGSNDNTFQELKNLNMLFVISAFETTNDHVLNILQKNHSSNDLNKAVELSLENNIDIRPTWMPFSPWTEQNDLISIIKLIENYKLRETVDPIQLTIKLLIPKNSLILKRPEMEEYLLNYEHDLLKEVFIFDYFFNEKKAEIKIGFRFIFQSSMNTLIDKKVNEAMNPIMSYTTSIEGITIPGMAKK